MADDNIRTAQTDRDRAAEGQDFDARAFAEAAGITEDQARELIKMHGNDHQMLLAAARAVKGTP